MNKCYINAQFFTLVCCYFCFSFCALNFSCLSFSSSSSSSFYFSNCLFLSFFPFLLLLLPSSHYAFCVTSGGDIHHLDLIMLFVLNRMNDLDLRPCFISLQPTVANCPYIIFYHNDVLVCPDFQ